SSHALTIRHLVETFVSFCLHYSCEGPKEVELRSWRDGKPFRTMKVPGGLMMDLHQMDDGSVYVSGEMQNGNWRSLYVRGNCVVASITGCRLTLIAADGGTALVRSTTGTLSDSPCAVSINNNRIVLRLLSSRKCCNIDSNGALLFTDGSLHWKGVTRQIVKGGPPMRSVGWSRRGTSFQLNGRMTVVSTATGRAWSFAERKGYEAYRAGISENGRFVAVYYQRDAFLKLRPLCNIIPPLARLLPERTRPEVLLYERPGKYVANISEMLGDLVAVDSNWYPSPDGRSVVGFAMDRKGVTRGVLLRRGR
ncbi:MAG: hypothetical protein ACYC6A_26015, partial [Armatimonadota bacterium]